jgi:hypothetical protein
MAKYTAVPGSPITDKQAKIVGGVIERMKASGVAVTAKNIVTEATSPKSPLHEMFDWNDESAAQKQRVAWARTLIGSVRIIEVRVARPSKAFYSVTTKIEGADASREYHTRKEVISNDDATNQVLLRLYRTIVSACKDAESLGVKDPWWSRVIDAVRRGDPTKMAG